MPEKWVRPKSIVHYVGVLLNADDHVLDIELPFGFEFSQAESRLKSAIADSFALFQFGHGGLHRETEYWRNASFWIRREYHILGTKLYPNARQRGEMLGLRLAVRILRLVAPGNLLLAEEYFVTEQDDKLFLGSMGDGGRPPYIETSLYSPTIADISIASDLISSIMGSAEDKEATKFERNVQNLATNPFQSSDCNVALQSYELSYTVKSPALAFLTLITALEVLYGSGAHRVARSAAVLLGTDEDDSARIYDSLTDMHQRRSKFVHAGKVSDISQADVVAARSICSRSILAISNLGMSKSVLSSKLNRLGFGDGQHLVSSRSG